LKKTFFLVSVGLDRLPLKTNLVYAIGGIDIQGPI
jgi:hypothetical protein